MPVRHPRARFRFSGADGFVNTDPNIIKLVRDNDIEGLAKVLDSGNQIDLDRRDLYPGLTAVAWAAQLGHVKILQKLLDANASVQLADYNGQSPLHWAVNSNKESVELLLKAGADDAAKTHLEETPLDEAISQGKKEQIILTFLDFLVKSGRDSNPTDACGKTVLFRAAKKGLFSTVKWLCNRPNSEADIDGVEKSRPLIAAASTKDFKLVKFLLDRGACVNVQDEQHQTPLHQAAMSSSPEVVQLLLDHKADPQILDKMNRTPLHAAARRGSVEVIQLLKATNSQNALEGPLGPFIAAMSPPKDGKSIPKPSTTSFRGDDSKVHDVGDAEGWTAIHFAARIGDAGAINALVGAGYGVNARNNDGESALMLAAQKGDVECLKAILTHSNADADLERKDGQTALTMAVNHGSLPVIEAILEKTRKPGANTRPCRISALRIAVLRNNKEATKRLIVAGYDIYARDGTGYANPLQLAVSWGDPSFMQTFFDGVASLSDDKDKDPPQLIKALQAALKFALRHDLAGRRIIAFVASKPAYCQFRNGELRTLLSWAAAEGHTSVVKELLDKGFSRPDTEDGSGRTPLSLAAEYGHENIVCLLLASKGVDQDGADKNGRTPLSWAADNGNEAVVTQLLLLRKRDMEQQQPQESAGEPVQLGDKNLKENDQDNLPAHHGAGPAGEPRMVKVDSQDNKRWTPLWYAAVGGHVQAFNALVDHGANPKHKVADQDLNEAVNDAINDAYKQPAEGRDGVVQANLPSLKEIRKLLQAYSPLWKELPKDSGYAERGFTGLILQFPRGPLDLKPRPVSVYELLTTADMSSGMRWVEVLMARHYEACGPEEAWNHNLVLTPRLWTEQQHIPQDESRHYARFMRTNCQALQIESKVDKAQATPPVASTTDTNLKTQGGDAPEQSGLEQPDKTGIGRQTSLEVDAHPGGLVLFMPYLHWERVSNFKELAGVLEKIPGTKNAAAGETSKRLSADAKDPNADSLVDTLKGTPGGDKDADAVEMSQKPSADTKDPNDTPKDTPEGDKGNSSHHLVLKYIRDPHPLHIRRTLDQFQYHTLSNTKARDADQTCLRHFEEKALRERECEHVMTMVDQLWLWVLPACGKSPETVITAFPQRCGNPKGDAEKDRSTWQTGLLLAIVRRCRDMPIRSGHELADIIGAECSRIYLDSTRNRHATLQFLEIYTSSVSNLMERDALRHTKFTSDIMQLNKSISAGKTAGDSGGTTKDEDKKDLKALLDIEEDIQDLRDIKDIRDELHIMRSLFRAQLGVFGAMHDITHGKKHRDGADRGGETIRVSLAVEAATRSLDEVERLDMFADRAAQSIDQLLELKQKQANLLLTNAIYNINDATEKQGKTIMWFTVVTIIFLPLSFMASFLALDITQFPWDQDKLPVEWVVKILLSTSLPLSLALLVVAFNLETTARNKHMATVGGLLARVRPSPRKLHMDGLKKKWRAFRERVKGQDEEVGGSPLHP